MNFAVNFEVVVDYLDKVAADGNAICPKEPWQVQEFVTGSEYSACCVVRNSQLLLVTVCRCSASQLNYVECQDQRLVSSIQAFMTKLVQDTLPPNTDGIFCLGITGEKHVTGCLWCKNKVIGTRGQLVGV